MVWAKNGTPVTLGSAGDVMTISDMTANKFNFIMFHKIATGDADPDQTFNNNTNSVYAYRQSQDGGTDGTGVSQTNTSPRVTANDDEFFISYLCSISGEEKLQIGFNCSQGAAGASTAARRMEYVTKFVPSPDADITRIDMTNDLTGSYDTSSNLSALGTD
jgi:hypothetical protein